MEYFDFDQAALTGLNDEGQLSCEDLNQSVDDNDSLLQLGDDFLSFSQPCFAPTSFDDFQTWVPSLKKPDVPCNNCQRSKLDCLIVHEGQYSCSSCVCLSKTCSFAIPEEDEEHGGALNDMPSDLREGNGLRGVSEDCTMENPLKPRKSGTRFSRAAVGTLKAWLAEHSSHPYPNDKEKDELKKQTGLKRSQISNWLANARRRSKVRSSGRTSPRPVGLGEPFPFPQGIAIPGAVDRPALKDMDPLERWKHSPPEHEPASVTDIAIALEKSRSASERNLTMAFEPQRSESSAGSSFSVFKAPSMASLEPGRSSGGSDLSLSSVYSHQSRQSSRHSFGSFPMVEKKERRRRRRPALVKQADSDGKRIFQCTFCTDCFKTKHDWQRHEKSLHLPLESWTCAKFGAVIVTPTAIRCAYCNLENLKSGHLETHNFQQCLEKSIAERTFYRKDHLRQHLRLAHGCSFVGQMETWKEEVVDLKSRCGFCDAKFTTWQARVDHIAAHFRAGMKMSDWKGDWGFEPKIQETVENAVPAFLIDLESKSVEPFSASKSVHTTERLERELLSWIEDRVSCGVHITDLMIQNQARIIVHESDNPWNETPADTAKWLEYIKQKSGLIEDSGGDSGGGDHEGLFPMEKERSFYDKWASVVLPPQRGLCYQVLERQLVEWIGEQISQGIIPSDTMIQDQARVIIYSSDDPWNQTAADNSQWLEMVKRKQGWIDEKGNWNLTALGEL